MKVLLCCFLWGVWGIFIGYLIKPEKVRIEHEVNAFVCTGKNDEVQIQRALNFKTTDGTCHFIKGIYYLSAPVTVTQSYYTLDGAGSELSYLPNVGRVHDSRIMNIKSSGWETGKLQSPGHKK